MAGDTVINFTFGKGIDARSARHNSAADATKVSSTFCRSNVERLITLRTSAVAVCCSSDCRSSSSSLTFSIAMAAWSAKVSTKQFVGRKKV